MSFRADIQGLRAVAVLMVITYHINPAWMPGGYVGVDVFFVISGYLITALLQRDIDAGQFSLVIFYERRIRRIVPALLSVLLLSSLAVPFFMLSADLRDYARSLFAVLTFSSNFYFYLTSDYFSTAAELKPLLHTWSLAVEEQFYILFPLLLAFLAKWPRKTVLPVLATLAALSLAMSVTLTAHNASGAFYLPLTRMWELLLGSILAQVPVARLERGSVFAWTGAAMIIAGGAVFTARTPFPGYAAALPCLGAVLVIAGGRGGVARVLGSWPMRSTGDISYSLYLWHWPVLAIWRYHFGLKIGPMAGFGLVVLTFVLAYLSWRFVELPWRAGKPQALVFRAAALGAFAIAIVAGMLHTLDSFVNRMPEQVQLLAAGANDINLRRRECNRPSVEQVRAADVCAIGAADAPASFVLVGDSIGDALMPGAEAAAMEVGRRGLVFVNGGCSPLFDVDADGTECMQFFKAVQHTLVERPELHTVVFVGRWAVMVEGGRLGESTDERFMKDAQTAALSHEENHRVFARAVGRIVHALPGRQIAMVAHVPEQSFNPPRVLAMQALRGSQLEVGISREQHEQRNARLRELLAGQPVIRVIDMTLWACTANECPVVTPDGRPLYSDDNHPSRHGALQWRGAFTRVLAQ